jgi:undecaprenyl-diphosphatase
MSAKSHAAPKRWWTSALAALGIGRIDRRELNWLVLGFGACLLLFIFVILAGEIAEGETQAFDVKVLTALRTPEDPSKPIGPVWLEGAMLDLTSLGGTTVLSLVIFAVVGFLLLQTRYHTALFVAITGISGELVSAAMKQTFNRPRPTVVPHLRDVYTTSFPSGHAMESAIVYLTLGAILMRVTESRMTKLYCLGMAMLLTLLVGISRVYIGVHYPTDVLGGWIIGFVWASICWLAAQHFEARAGITAERTKTAEG